MYGDVPGMDQIVEFHSRDAKTSVSIEQYLGERAQITLLLAQRSAGVRDGSDLLPVSVVENNFSRRADVNGRATKILPQESGPCVPRDQVLKGWLPVPGQAQRIAPVLQADGLISRVRVARSSFVSQRPSHR
jgi:hypothetical protein